MELLWYKPADDGNPTTSAKWHELDIDTLPASVSNAVFFSSPFAIGMNPETFAPDRQTNPFPGDNEAKPVTQDMTSLKMGERGILNPLWQYNELADPRTLDSAIGYGRVYNRRIRPNNPLVFIQPGRPKFYGIDHFGFGGGSEADDLRAAVVDSMDVDATAGGDAFNLTTFLNELSADTTTAQIDKGGPMKFYDFEPDFKRYRAYVTSLITELMIRMHIDFNEEDEKGKGKFTALFGTVTDYFTKFMDYYGFWEQVDANNSNGGAQVQSAFIPFRIEKTSSADDSFSTTAEQPSAASQIKGISDQAKEVAFLTNKSQGIKDGATISDALSGAKNLAGDIAGTLSGGAESIIKTGGNILFPDIWKESTYQKNISLNIKLHAPNGNPNVYLENILFPVACVLGFIMPRQTGSSVYASPPIVRLYSKGWFSCTVGIVTSVTIKRGSDSNDWTVARLPRTVEISMEIKDLFGTMVMSMGGNNPNNRLFYNKNSMLRDYLNVLGGIDAFSSSNLSTRVKNAFKNAVFGWQRFFDSRTFFAGLAMNPVLAPAAKIRNVVRGWF